MSEVLQIELTPELMQVLTAEQAWHYRIVPKADNGTLSFFIDEKVEASGIDNELEMLLGRTIELHPIATEVIQKTLSVYYRKQEYATGKKYTANPNSDDFVINLISEAKGLKSSDIHIERYEEKARVRFRIDGMLVERYMLEKEEYPSVINRLKIMANLDIAEKRLPQDGRIFFQNNGQKFDIRVSILPTLHGEKVVMRILSNDATNVEIKELGFSELDLKHYMEGAKMPNGMLLISGPTGSGKTTTLYATLKLLNKQTKNIITIEDPIEYTLEGINQVQLKEAIGLNFGAALRTFLRQDPDIIMVGEIRDPDTASMAVRAALTGHLVLSTIHTNSAWGTVSRLIDMGIPPYLIANTLNTSVAQRLVRKLCSNCKQEEAFDVEMYPRQFRPFEEVTKHYLPVGCDECFHTGYKGRKAVYEVIPMDQALGDKIKSNEHDVSSLLKERKVRTLAENAFNLFKTGETSLEEVYSLLMNF